jgi:alcohol dehydrogenase class IV
LAPSLVNASENAHITKGIKQMAIADDIYGSKESLWAIDLEPGALFGVGSRKKTGERLKGYGATSVLLVCDLAMEKLGYAEELTEIIKASGIEVFQYAIEPKEPTSTECNNCVAFARKHTIDGIVGLGGGSAIDVAKMTGLVLANGGKTENYLGYGTDYSKTKTFRPVIALPTTSGTGAEVSTALAIEDDTKNIKAIGMHRATFAIVDPSYTVGLPKEVTANTGIDALSHALDSVCNTAGMRNWLADALSYEGMRVCHKWLPVAYEDSDNLEARSWMSYAAMVGGYILKLRRCSWAHAFANKVSDRYHLPHGVGCSLGLYGLVRYNVTENPEANRIIARSFGVDCPEGADMVEVGKKLVKATDDLQKRVGMKTMKEAGLDKGFIDDAIDKIKNDGKWKLVPNVPNFEVMAKSIYEAFEM